MELLSGVAAADTGPAASFVAERVTLEDMRIRVYDALQQRWPENPAARYLVVNLGSAGEKGGCCSSLNPEKRKADDYNGEVGG